MTAQFAFDTLAFVKRLSAAGMEARQAEALAEALTAHAFDELVTKEHLQSALDKLELRLTVRMGVLAAATITILGALITLH
ncbi:MAG: Coiled-coil protein 90-like [Sphingomonadales bacterium]|jgi:hypothetical protein|nr:Coiled-coil protein 90-like [Sphingomonadales bacterium]